MGCRLHCCRSTDRAGRSGSPHANGRADPGAIVSFDAVTPWYRTLETVAFGNALQRARLACLAEIQAPSRVLIVGEGDGRFLFQLLRMHPSAEIDCVDA